MEKIKFQRKIWLKNSKSVITLPTELSDWLEININTNITLIPDEGKHGKFIAIFVEGDTDADNDTNSTE